MLKKQDAICSSAEQGANKDATHGTLVLLVVVHLLDELSISAVQLQQ